MSRAITCIISMTAGTAVSPRASACPGAQDRFCHPEPILRTLKAANATTHALAGIVEPLLVVNLHAVNFSLGMQA